MGIVLVQRGLRKLECRLDRGMKGALWAWALHRGSGDCGRDEVIDLVHCGENLWDCAVILVGEIEGRVFEDLQNFVEMSN